MTKLQKQLEYLQDNHLFEWMKTRKVVEDELSRKQSMFCVCGMLATGLHESHCRKFREVIAKETVERLNYLIE